MSVAIRGVNAHRKPYKNPMGRKYIKKEKVLVLKHDVILGSTYELVDVETDVTQMVGGGETMTYESSVVIPLGKPDKNGDTITREAIQQSIDKVNASDMVVGLTISDHVLGDEKIVIVKNKRKEDSE